MIITRRRHRDGYKKTNNTKHIKQKKQHNTKKFVFLLGYKIAFCLPAYSFWSHQLFLFHASCEKIGFLLSAKISASGKTLEPFDPSAILL